MTNRVMTPEYAALSLAAGAMAGTIDRYIGEMDFLRFVRKNAWTLTRRHLVEMESVALSVGVPAEALEETKEMVANVLGATGIEPFLELQAKRDAARSRSPHGAN